MDSIVLMAVNRPLFGLNDFKVNASWKQKPNNGKTPPSRPVFMGDDARKRFIALYETRINEQIYYPPAGETTPYRRHQAPSLPDCSSYPG